MTETFKYVHLLLSFPSIQKSRIVTEHERQNTLNRIIEAFADAIDALGGFDDKSKTAMKSKKDGTKSGIKAMMERWFLIQELYGVCLYFSLQHLGKQR